MNVCLNIKQKFNELRIKGKKSMKLNVKETTKAQLDELRECGFIVKQVKNHIIITE